MGDMYVIDRICIGYDLYQRLCTLASPLCMYSRMMSATGVYKVLDNLVLTIVALIGLLVENILYIHFCVGCDGALYSLTTDVIHNVVGVFGGYLLIF